MARGIRDIEKCFKLLRRARNIFSDLSGDSITSLSKMHRWCVEVDKLIYETEEE